MRSNGTYLDGRNGITIDQCPDCGQYFLSATERRKLAVHSEIEEVYEKVIKAVHAGEKPSKTESRAIIQEQYASLRNAVKEGAGKLAVEFEYGTPNQTMLKNIQTNIAVFGAFKKHDMIRELVKGLRDDEGNLKEWQEFRKFAKPLVGDYRERYLHIEYDAAVRGSRMATVWQDIQKTKRLYPNIEYTRSVSANKREDHLELVGIVLPIDHPFWAAHFPPNGYLCKCGARPTDKQPTHDDNSVPTVKIDPAFEINPGKDGQVFDVSKHPYGQMPKTEFKAAAKEAWSALCSYERRDLIQKASGSGMMNKKIKVERLSAPVQLNRNSYAKNLTHDQYFFEKLSLLNDIETVLEESDLILTENRKPKQHVKQYHILQYVTADGKKVNTHIEERKDGKMYLYYLHVQK